MLISKEYYDFLQARIAQLEDDVKRLTNAMCIQGGLRAPYEFNMALPPPAGRKSWDQVRKELEESELPVVK